MIREEWRKKELWENYWSRPYKNYRKHHELFWNLIRNSSSGLVLDLGCGPACVWEGTGAKVIGVDFSEEGIKEARLNVPWGKFVVASLDKRLPLDEKFDTIVLCGVVNYFPDFTNILTEIGRLSHKGTKVLITINDLHGLNGREWTEENVIKEFGKWGSEVEATFYDRVGWFIIIVM